ncbi:MAG: hypothetical protein M1608_07685, partial [Candidatus Omnitrophica bacterium]|nr:hypothetical protein [Candidatus Omnitrophota bacterium]
MSLYPTGRVSEESKFSELRADTEQALDTAIARSQEYLLAQQKPEGYWVGELIVDSTLVTDMVAYHHWNGQ